LCEASDVRNICKHNGAVLPRFAALVGRERMALMLWYFDDAELLVTFEII
jgi:hypothetical protein